MSCKLTILDPTLKYWLKSNTFDSFKEFKTAINQALLKGFIPVGNELKIIKEGSVEVEVNGVTKTLQVKNTNSLIDIVLKGTLDSNNESDHFESFMSSFEDIYNKYKTQEIIPNSEKNTDKDFLETMLSFFEGYPVSDEFKQGETFNNFLAIKDFIRNVKEKIEDELEGDEEFETNESLIKNGEPQEYYEYTLAAFYKPDDSNNPKPTLDLNDELSLLKHNVSKEVNRQIKEDGAEFYISFAKDNPNNAQSQGWEDYVNSDKFKQSGFGVVGYLYKVVAGETKRVYIKSHEKKFNGKVVLTTDPKEAIKIGKNEVTGFTYTLPDFTSGRYNDVNEDVRSELVQFREDVRATGIESAPFKINGVVEEYPQAHKKNNPYERRKITALTFLQGKSPELLRLATKEEKIVYAGNLYLQMEDSKVPLDRLPLSDAWAKAVYDLLKFELYTPAEAESVTKSLNKLLDFKGGDIRFINWGNKIIPQRKSIITEVDGKKRFERLKEPVNISVDEAFEVLEYARINVHKEWLNEGTVAFPIIFFKNVPTGELRSTNIDVRDFYLKHHATVYRQMNVVGDTVYGPILSPIFDVKTKGKIISEKIGAFQDNPTIGDFQVTPDGEYPLMDVLKELPSIINRMEEGKDALSLIEALIENPEIKAKLEGVKIKFTSKDIQGTADTDLIQIGFNQLFNPTKAGEILAHEIIHVLTSDWILFNSNHELVKELDSLIEKVPESVYDLLAKQGYGRDANGNPHPNFKLEVLARLSDPQVANALKEVGSKKSTLLDKLLDIVKKILEKVFPDLAKVDPSLYTDLLESLVKIATHRDITDTKKKKVPDVLPKNLDVIFGDAPPPISFDGFGYSAEDLYEMEEKGYSQVFLDKVKQRIDVALTNFIYNKGGLQHLLTGQVGFEEVFEYYFHSLRPRVEYLRDKGNSLELDYYTFVLLNKDFVKDYWINKTGLVKLRKPKKGEKATVEVDTDVTDVTINDTSEVTDREKEEIEQVLAEIHGGGDVIEKVADFDRSGAEFSSLESADKMAIAFVKIIPKIQRDSNGTVKYNAIPEDDSKDYYIPVGSQFIRFETDEANQLVSNDYTQTWSLMAKQFTNKLSLEEMLDSLDNNPKLVESVPEIYVLKHRLSTDIKTPFQASLNAKIERSFKSAPVQIIVMLQDTNGRLNFIDESSDVTSIGKRKVDSGFLALINSEKFSTYYDRENDLVDIESLIKVGLKLPNLEDAQKVSLSSLLGFGFHPDTLKKNGVKRSEVNDFEDALYHLLTNAEDGKISTGISEVILKGTLGKDGNMIDGLNNYFKSVIEIENSIRPLNVSLMVPNAEGELQNTLFQFNSLLQYRKHYNDAQSIEELNDLIGRTKNDLFEYSLTKRMLFPTTIKDGEEVTERSKVQVKVVNLSGSKKAQKGRASEGELTINLDSSEWLKLNFVSMLDKKSGFIENTRAETASTTYAFTLSTWGKSSDYYVPVLMSEVSSDWSKDKREFNIIKDSRIYGIWESYLKGEISRIKKQNLDTPKWGLFTDILNDEEKTQMLEEITPEVLIPALNRFFTAQFQEYDNLFENEMGGLDVIPDKSLKARIENNLDVVKAFVVMNTMILHNEESILFQGDISQTPQYYKRAKGVQSTGTPMSKSESLIKFINKELATNSFGSMLGFPFQIGKNFNSATIADDKKPSAFLSKFKTGFAESRRLYYNALGLKFEEEQLLKDTDTLLEDYKEVNIGDGGSVAHPDFYASILDLSGNFSEDQRKVHQALMLDARKDAKLYFGEEFAKKINSVLTKEEEAKLKEGFDLMLEGKGQLPLVKFTIRDTMSNTDSVVVPEVMDKFAIFPLYPQFIHDKEVARELFKSMLKEQIGYVKFKSGTKIDTTPPLDIIKMIEDGQVDISFGESKHELQLEYLREQIKTPEKHKKKNTFGTQVRKNVLAELGHVKLQNEKNKGDTKRKWEGLIQQFSLATEKEVLGRLGIKAIGEKWDFTSIDKVKVAEILLEEAETKDLPINIRTYFDEYRKNKINNLENAYEYFESSMGSQQIQNLLASIIKKISIQKLNGTQFRQIPVSMFSKKIMSDGKTRDLGFYVLESVIGKSDKIIFGHPGIGKTFLRETRDDFIDVDNDYKEEHSTQQILRSHAKNTGKKEDLKAWEDYITTWWSKVKDDAVKSGKQIFVSNLPILRMFPQDFDKVITMSKETFVERAKQRNDYIPGEEGTEGWKNSLDVAIDKIDKSKVITTDKYLSDLLKSRVVPAECKIGMGGDFVNLLNLQDVEDYLSQNKLEDTTMNRLRALNKKLEDESWVEAHKDVLTIASYRIPNQGHNSDEVMVIREFLPPMHAGEIVLPPEVTTQSGTDYDYDKMSAIVPKIDSQGRYIDYKNLTKEYQDLTYENFLALKEDKKKDIFLLREEKSFVLNKLFAQLKDFKGQKDKQKEYKAIYDKFIEFQVYEINYEISERESVIAELRQESSVDTNLVNHTRDQIRRLVEYRRNLINARKENRLEYENFKQSFELQKQEVKQEQWEVSFNYSDSLRDKYDDLTKLNTSFYNKKDAIQNEMIKTFADILLDPVNYHKLIVPNSNAIVFNLLKKDLLPKLYKGYDPNAKLRPTEIVTIKRNLRQFKAVKGKDLLGIAAVWNPFTTILQNHNIEIQNFYTKKIGFGPKAKSVQVDVVPKLGNKKVSLFTMDGTNKLEIISQLVNVTVDMPSDDTFGMSALRQDDFGAFIYSISALSYNFKDAMYLFHQPIVLDFKIKVSNKVKSGTKRYKAVTEVLYELFGIPIEKKKDAIDYTKSENQLYSKILGEYEENLNPELLFEDVKPIGEKYEITEQQKAVLAHYIKLLDQASHLRVAQQALNFDTSPDNNLAKARQRKENYKDAVASGIIHKDKLNEVMLNSVISGLYVSDIFESLITEMFPVLYSEENKTMFTELAGNYKQNQEIAFRKAASDFLLAIVQNYGKVNGLNITDVVSPFIEGKYKTLLMKGASDTIEKLKKEGKNYRLLNILTVSIAKDGNKANPQLTLGLENNSDDKNILTEEFRDLLKSEDPKIKSFAEHLAIIGFIQSGWSKSPLYFSDLIPKEFITPIINESIKAYESLDETEKKGFLSAFFENFDYYEGISLGRSKRERHTDSYRLMDWRRGVAEKIADFKKEDAKKQGLEIDESKPEFNKLPLKSKTKTFTYAGIGSRETPPEVLELMTELAKELESRGYTLRSGAAPGADSAFEKGATKKEIFKGSAKTGERELKIAEEIHPNWNGMLEAARRKAIANGRDPEQAAQYVANLMARNTNQVFGKNLDIPVDFVVAWTQDGLTDYKNRSIDSGGTGQAIDMASRKGIPVFNLKNPDWRQQLDKVLEQPKDEYLDYVETLNKNKTSDTYQYFGATYNIILENGKGIDVEGYQGKNKNKQKLLEAYNTNPNVDPQSGKAFRTTPVEQPTQSAQKNFYEFSDGFKVETDFALNEEQKEALKDLEDFVKGKSKTIALSGAAGTGKTTVVSIFDKWLKNKKYIYPKYSAPTHRANAVTKLMNPSANVFTLHSLFGLTPDIEFEESNFDVKELEFAQKNKPKIEKGDVLIIDESSMISDSLFDFLESAQTIHNVRIIYVGDYAQLKPVKQKEKSKVFTGSHKVSNLVKVERTGENAILAESVNIREGKDWSYQTSLNSKREGVEYISTREQMFEIADKLFLEQSVSENKMKFRILSATNKAVTEVNQMIRKVLYKANGEKQLVKGELLMGYDNFDYNYKTGQFKLYNGGDYEVKEISPSTKTVESIGETFTGFSVLLQNVFDSKELPVSIFVADINEDDSKAIKLADEIQKLQKAGQKAMSVGMGQEAAFYFAEANALKSKVAFMKDITKFDSADKKPKVVIRKTFDYGYAHTIHKAQGGTYENVMILADTLAPFDKNSQQELKYVAVSRAKKIAYIRTNHELKQPLVQDNTQEQTKVDKSLSWGVLEDLPVYSDKGVMVMRKQGNEHFGNPFTGSGVKGLIQTQDIPTAVQAYKDWLKDNYVLYEDKNGVAKEIQEGFKKEQRDWILSQIEQGKLDNKTLLYMKDKGEYYSHADALAEIVNERKQDDTKSNSILKFEKLPKGSVTLGRYEIRDNKAPNSLQYDGRVAPSNMSGSSIGEILQSADTPRIKSYRIANYLLDTLYVSKGWQNSIVQDLANRGVVVKTHLLADDSESPGIMSQQGDIITINVRAIEREIENYGTAGFDNFLTDSLDEEIIHLLTVKLASEEDISNIAKELSKEDRQKVTDYYFSKTNDPDETLRDRSIAMEYVRMVVQQKLFGRTTEDSKQVILGLVPTIKKLLNEVLDYLINLFEKNPQSVSTKVINSLITVIQNESLDNFAMRSDRPTNTTQSTLNYESKNSYLGKLERILEQQGGIRQESLSKDYSKFPSRVRNTLSRNTTIGESHSASSNNRNLWEGRRLDNTEEKTTKCSIM